MNTNRRNFSALRRIFLTQYLESHNRRRFRYLEEYIFRKAFRDHGRGALPGGSASMGRLFGVQLGSGDDIKKKLNLAF